MQIAEKWCDYCYNYLIHRQNYSHLKEKSLREEKAKIFINAKINAGKGDILLHIAPMAKICIKIDIWQEQQALIEHFINRIYVWEDKIVIAFNFTPTRKISDDTDEIDIDAIIKAITENCSVIAVVVFSGTF